MLTFSFTFSFETVNSISVDFTYSSGETVSERIYVLPSSNPLMKWESFPEVHLSTTFPVSLSVTVISAPSTSFSPVTSVLVNDTCLSFIVTVSSSLEFLTVNLMSVAFT